MKALLLKDFYQAWKYFRNMLLLLVVFWGASIYDSDNYFLLLYPCAMAGFLTFSLQSYDEQSGWVNYSAALPYSRKKLVSVKYLMCLCLGLPTLIVTLVVQSVRTDLSGSLQLSWLLTMASLLLTLLLLVPSVTLPLMFWLGSEKSRFLSFFGVGAVCGLTALGAASVPEGSNTATSASPSLFLLLALGTLFLFGASWWISTKIYEKREL